LFAAFMLLQHNMGLLTAAVQHVQSGQDSSPKRVSSPSSERDYASCGDSQIVIEEYYRAHYYTLSAPTSVAGELDFWSIPAPPWLPCPKQMPTP